jgi:hypothetical protein
VRQRRDDALGWPTADETPPTMWSDAGAGFEADPFSPAGEMQRQWWFFRRLGRMSDRELEDRAGWAFRSALPVMALFAAGAIAVALLSLLVSWGLALAAVVLLIVVWFTKRQ